MIFCSNCGNKLLQASKFCSSCGANITLISNESGEVNTSNSPLVNTKASTQLQHKSLTLSPIGREKFSKTKKIVIGFLGLIILFTGYITLGTIVETETVTTTSEKVLTKDEENAARFKTLLPQLDKDADIHKDISERDLVTLITLVNMNGYKCDTVTFAIPYIRKHGYSLTCNNNQYSYEIEDKGGNFIVTVN